MSISNLILNSRKTLKARVGAHVSTAGGILKSLDRANKIGANCLQIFSGSPRVWARRGLELVPASEFITKTQELDIQPVFTHAIYLVNLASKNDEILQKSINVLQHDLDFDALIRGSGVIVHLGSHLGEGWESVREKLAQRILSILKNSPQNSTFLIENSAGQNGKIGSDLSEIAWLFSQIDQLNHNQVVDLDQRLGWCLDTCHAFSAGYGLYQSSEVSQPSLLNNKADNLISTIEKLDLGPRLRLVHVNDSRDKFGSGRDRHANIGQGNIPGLELASFLQHRLIANLPMIIEVPGDENQGPDAPNIGRLHQLLSMKVG